LLKSLNKELTSLRARAVDLSSNEDPKELAQHLLRELVAADRHVEVGYAGGQRYTLVAREAAGLGQDPNQARAASNLIDEHSVVLLSGGGRGITSLVARALARRFRCTLELVGRSESRAEEDNEIAQARDLESLRGLLVRRARSAGERQPSEIERACRSILAAREIRETLADCRRAGARVEYHAVDVSNEAEFGALIDRLRERHGRIDGVIHGAGAIEDKLFADKEVDSFLRVYRTKVVGALTLAEKLASVARFFVFFSSVSGAFGNRGQTDYAAANDVLDKLARRLHAADGVRTVSINWGPWRGGGMVRPELEREYDRRGVGMISPHDGVMSFLDELEQGADPQVVLTAVTPEGFG
jgi:NAD(P)-dependent dehydrogenase (short-subunit alcohol dehydrogenase family)